MTTLDARVDRDTAWVRELERALGAEHVLGPHAVGLEDYLDPFPLGTGSRTRPAGVVRPGSVEEVQEVVRVAARHGLHLWTVSRGRNYSYGGAEARVPGSIVCDLGRLDSVISVDEATGAAIIEPGVSFWALDEHLRATGSRFAVSVPDLSWGSPLANVLERGFSYTAQADHQGAVCGMEVVLADGDLVRTGMGALPGGDTWALYRGGYGPGLDGLFLQSNLGIVTKIGLWLRPRPQRVAACAITVPEEGRLGALVEALRPLLLDDTIQSNVVIGNAVVIASMITRRDGLHDGDGVLPDAALQQAIDRFHLGRWNARFGLYGTAAMVGARRGEVEAAVAAVPGAVLSVTEYDGDVDPATVPPPDRAQLGVPSDEAIAMIAWRGGTPSHSDIGLVCPPTAEDVTEVRRLTRRIVEAHGHDHATGFMLFKRHVVALSMLMFDGDDAGQRAAANAAIERIIAEGARAGYGPYRAHVDHMDRAAAVYSFNGHAGLRLAERLKDALDPAGLLSPGKQGIWPQGPDRDRARADRTPPV